ncbi:GrpB family protein [Sutcliffiella horikoshii]|uniref:GrpB family protein n=1 Tax=Sutcliffiella horikoshii TaxID=79883 RepID=UPI00384A91FA
MDNSNEYKKMPVWAFETIEIKYPDPNWKDKGIREKEELFTLLSAFSIKEVEHVGSTSIPNLPAKPIIDLMASIPSFNLINEIEETLISHDWHYVPPELDKQPWRRFFVKVKNDKQVAHLQLILEGEERWDEILKFRNILRNNPNLANEYAVIKSHLAKEYNNDRETYTEAKRGFINKVLFN